MGFAKGISMGNEHEPTADETDREMDNPTETANPHDGGNDSLNGGNPDQNR